MQLVSLNNILWWKANDYLKIIIEKLLLTY